MDEVEYHIDQPEVILGILVSMIRGAQDALNNNHPSQESKAPL